METGDIKTAIRKTLGIGELNAMQSAVTVCDAQRLILLSPTGSGKTVAFVIAILRRITRADITSGRVNTVVIAPSRELVRQIHNVVRPVATLFGIKTLALYGGNPFSAEEASIKGSMPTMVIATPGRLLDHADRGTLDLSGVRDIVLDEYDKILELGFHDEMRRIGSKLSETHSTTGLRFVMATSATRLDNVPGFIDIATAETIDFTQTSSVSSRLRVVNVPSQARDKLDVLGALVRDIADRGPCIVFVNHRESADRIGAYLERQHISAVVYHGGLDQQHREMALARFDSRAASVLVSTDLAGRGIDIDSVQSVIHYHPAADVETWTHRNGRTARIDRTGDVYVITGPDEDIPEFVAFDNDHYPDMTSQRPVRAEKKLIYLDRGKRDKISRGDIAGFVMKKAEVPADEVGKITLGHAYSLVAVSPHYASAVIEAAKNNKIKNTRVRASIVK